MTNNTDPCAAPLPDGTPLYGGRYVIDSLAGEDPDVGYVYRGTDLADDSPIAIHEFFPRRLCRRGSPDGTGDMAILKAHAPQAATLYRRFSDHVASRKAQDDPTLLRAFRERGTAFFVTTPEQTSAALPNPATRPSEPASKTPSKPRTCRIASPHRPSQTPANDSSSGTSGALLWYRIVVVLLAAIVVMMLYLNIFA